MGAEYHSSGQGRGTGAAVGEHPLSDDETARKQNETTSAANAEDVAATAQRVVEVEREDFVYIPPASAESKLHQAAHDSVAQDASTSADKGEPVSVTVGPAVKAPVPGPPPRTIFKPRTTASTPVAPKAEPVAPTPVAKQPEVTSLDDIEALLSTVDVNESTQPKDANADLASVALGRASRRARFSMRDHKNAKREAAAAVAAAEQPQAPKPEVPKPDEPEPTKPIVIKEVVKEKASPTPPQPEKPTPVVPQPEAIITSVPKAEDLAREAAAAAKPEAKPTPEVTRPSREHHTPSKAEDHHVVHNNVPRKSWFERIRDVFTQEVPVEQPAQPVAPEAPVPGVPTPEVPATTEAQPSWKRKDIGPELDALDKKLNPLSKEDEKLYKKGEAILADMAKDEAKARREGAATAREIDRAHRTTAEDKQRAWGETHSAGRTTKDLEAYKEARAAKPEGEEAIRRSVDKNGRPIFYNQSGVQVSQQAYEASLYDTPNARTAHLDYYYEKQRKDDVNAVHDEALGLNEAHDKEFSAALRARAEGERLVLRGNDPRLRGLMGLGQELRGMSMAPAEQQGVFAATNEAKRQMFNDLVELYRSQGVDERAIGYILHETIYPIDHANYDPIKGSAYYNGEKVTVRDYNESPDGKQSAYVIEQTDGTIISAFGSEIEFKREYGAVANTPEEAEQLSKAQKVKEFIKGIGPKMRKYAGELGWKAWGEGENKIVNFKTEGLSDEALEAKQNKNRRNFMIGAAVIAGASTVGAFGLGVATGHTIAAIQDILSPDVVQPLAPGLGGGMASEPLAAGIGGGFSFESSAQTGAGSELFTADGLERALEAEASLGETPTLDAEGDASTVEADLPTADLGIENAAYTIAEKQGGLELFGNLDISETTWYENAGTLVRLFPEEFEFQGNDVWIKKAGQLSEDARRFIETLRTR